MVGVYDIHNRFGQCNLLQGGHIESIHIVPKVDPFEFLGPTEDLPKYKAPELGNKYKCVCV